MQIWSLTGFVMLYITSLITSVECVLDELWIMYINMVTTRFYVRHPSALLVICCFRFSSIYKFRWCLVFLMHGRARSILHPECRLSKELFCKVWHLAYVIFLCSSCFFHLRFFVLIVFLLCLALFQYSMSRLVVRVPSAAYIYQSASSLLWVFTTWVLVYLRDIIGATRFES